MNQLQTINDQNVELVMAKQEIEILKLQNQLEKNQIQKASRLEDSLFSPKLFEHYQKVAKTYATSGMTPAAYKDKPEAIFIAMAMAYQLGLPIEQALMDIAIISNRPCLWGDGFLAVILAHKDCESIEENPIYEEKTGVIIGYTCTVKRKGHKPHSKHFTIHDATVAGLVQKGGVWKTYPARMLQLRARGFALRDKFADALRGVHIAEIVQDDENIIDITPIKKNDNKQQTQTEKLKKILQVNESSEEVQNTDKKQEIQKQLVEPEKVEPEDNTPITEENLLMIQCMMDEKKFDDVRKLKAMDYFKVSSLSELTNAQAKTLKVQLSRA